MTCECPLSACSRAGSTVMGNCSVSVSGAPDDTSDESKHEQTSLQTNSISPDGANEYPLLGLSLNALLAILEYTRNQGWADSSSEQVCSRLKDMTLPYGDSFAGIIATRGTDPWGLGIKRSDIHDKATVFMSHARKGKFSDLIEAAVEFAESKAGQQREAVAGLAFWIDILVLDQNASMEKDADFFETVFTKAVHTIGCTVVQMTPWKAPLHLSRIWCLYEVLISMQGSVSLHIALGRSDTAQLEKQVAENPSSILGLLSHIDCVNATAFDPTDLKRISAAIEKDLPGGFQSLNIKMLGLLREWLQQKALDHLARVEREHADADHEDVAFLRATVALMFKQMGLLDDAGRLYRKAHATYEKLQGTGGEETLTVANNLAMLLRQQGLLGEAEQLYDRSLQGLKELHGSQHPYVMTVTNNLAAVLSDQGKLDQAEALYRQVLAGRESALGNDDPGTLQAVNNLAVCLEEQKSYEEANALHQRSLLGREKLLGAKHPATLMAVNNVGRLYLAMGRRDDAESLYQRALSGRTDVLGSEHPDTLYSAYSLAGLYRSQGKLEQAAALCRQVAEGYAAAFGRDHEETRVAYSNLIGILRELGQTEEAVRIEEETGADLSATE